MEVFNNFLENPLEIILEFIQNPNIRNIEFFVAAILLSLIIGRYTPSIVRVIIHRFSPTEVTNIYEKIIAPISNLLRWVGTLFLIYISLELITQYQVVYNILRLFIDLALIANTSWLISRLAHLYIHTYGINLARQMGYQVDDIILIFETIINVIIGFVAVITFAKDRFDLVGLITGLGIGGVAVAFAAQKTLEQLLGTLVLYLDRPFSPGEYIRVPSSTQSSEGLFGRVESIGLRSSKIRTAAKSTLVIVPNSILANQEVENITRGKKVMVLLYLNFEKKLGDKETALVQQVIQESTNSLLGIDPGSTNIALSENSETNNTRARVTFFILGSTNNSIELRKQLLKLANEKVSERLKTYKISFVLEEPNIYVESPITI
ncbi:MAG: mechanosensitive ion channel domain-containing protein [Cyanobacteria bacterium P01_A01_bin.84]